MKPYNNLLEKYLKAETSRDEELLLREQVYTNKDGLPENVMFGFFDQESRLPQGFEDELFGKITETRANKRYFMYKLVAAAASIALVTGVYFGMHKNRDKQLEANFAMMENALTRVSQSIQPDHPDEMLVLWVDENVEIIIK